MRKLTLTILVLVVLALAALEAAALRLEPAAFPSETAPQFWFR